MTLQHHRKQKTLACKSQSISKSCAHSTHLVCLKASLKICSHLGLVATSMATSGNECDLHKCMGFLANDDEQDFYLSDDLSIPSDSLLDYTPYSLERYRCFGASAGQANCASNCAPISRQLRQCMASVRYHR